VHPRLDIVQLGVSPLHRSQSEMLGHFCYETAGNSMPVDDIKVRFPAENSEDFLSSE